MEKHDTTKRNSARYVIKARKLLVERSSLVELRSLNCKRKYDKIKIKRLALDYSGKVKTYYKLLHEVEAFKEHVYAAFSLVHHELCTSQCVIAGHSEYVKFRPHRNLICKHSVAAQQMHEAETDIALLRKRIDRFFCRQKLQVPSANPVSAVQGVRKRSAMKHEPCLFKIQCASGT